MALMIGKTDLRDYVIMADEAIYIKLIKSQKDVDTGTQDSFHPEFTHQLFGQEEKIFGYKDLEVRLWYTASQLTTHLSIKYSDKIDPKKHDGVEPDDIKGIILSKLETLELAPSLDEFVKYLDKEAKFRPIGELIKTFSLGSDHALSNGHSYGISNGGGDHKESEKIEVYRADITTPGFREYHDKMQTFLWWYIEAVSYIDVDDDRWEYFTIFRKDNSTYTFVGYATVYRYYAYPDQERPRISQVIILPPFQKRGVGARFLSAIYDWYIPQTKVLDITVEEPSDDFIRLRDYVDCKRAAALPTYQPISLKSGWCEEMASEAREKLRLCKRQARRVYEILRLRATDTANTQEYRAYRVAIKNRLNAPFLKDAKDKERQRAKGMLSTEEFQETIMGKDERIKLLEKMFNQLEQEYRHTIERLALDN